MKFEKITENVENISILPDDPTLTSEQLKKEFDKGNKTIKEAFNTQVDQLNKTTIEESGSNENGTWIKFNEGTMIVTQKHLIPLMNSNIDYGPLSRSERISLKSKPYPVKFLEIYSLNMQAQNDGSGWMLTDTKGTSLEDAGGFFFITANDGVVRDAYIHVIVIGRWK